MYQTLIIISSFKYSYVTICAMVKVYDNWIQVSYTAPLNPIFLVIITSYYFFGYYYHENGMNLYIPISGIYLYCILVWLHIIYHIDKSTNECHYLSNYQNYHTN